MTNRAAPLPAPPELKQAIEAYYAKHKKLYSAVPHPDFAHMRSTHGPERLDAILPDLGHPGGSVLDIGTHWGAFAHWLEDHGYRVTACEISARHASIARGLRDISGKTFEIVEGSFYDLDPSGYDIVLALNIFHHSLKTPERFEQLERFVRRIDSDVMIFESHFTAEPQMQEAYKNIEPEEFVELIGSWSGLKNSKVIGHEGRRPIFKLMR